MTIISSGIYPINPTVTDGTQLAGYINELVEAINSQQASATRPPLITKGGLWTKTLTGDDIAVMVYDGSVDLEVAKVVDGEIVGVSLWTEVGGVAVYDGDIEVNGVTVGEGGGSLSNNTVVGRAALLRNTTGNGNTAIGSSALANSTDENNTAIGLSAGSELTSGSNNVIIGRNAQASTPSTSNEVTIGNNGIASTRLMGDTYIDGGLNIGNDKFIIDTSANATIATNTPTTWSCSSTFLKLACGSGARLSVQADGKVVVEGNLTTTGSITSGTLATVSSGTNVVCNADGTLLKTTAVYMTEEQVDKKLAIKDKLIEKLAEKLDALELKFKALGSTKKGKK